MSAIQWTNKTVNTLLVRRREDRKVGWWCVKTQPACAHCYAETINMDHRAVSPTRRGVRVRYMMKEARGLEPYLDEAALERLSRMRKPCKIFPNDMTDGWLSIRSCQACGETWEDESDQPADACRRCDADGLVKFWPSDWLQRHLDIYDDLARKGFIIQSLTKRPRRMALELRRWYKRTGRSMHRNFWPGFSAGEEASLVQSLPWALEAARYTETPPWISYEPALGRLGLAPVLARYPDARLSWAVLGGESGRSARVCDIEWLEQALADCRELGIPAFVKQLGAKPVRRGQALTLKDRKGGDPAEWPASLVTRNYPTGSGEAAPGGEAPYIRDGRGADG